MRDSFTGPPTTPPWSVLEFVRRSPSFTLATLARVNFPAALELLRVRFPGTHAAYDGESAAQFLDRLRFPPEARALALELFARSFFADPREFGADELVAVFHTYFMGSAEGLLFDVPDDDYDTALGPPRPPPGRARRHGPHGRPRHGPHAGRRPGDGAGGRRTRRGGRLRPAADPRSARELVAALPDADPAWRDAVAATRNAPPFVVIRLWLDRAVDAERPAFLGTTGYGDLDNVSALERFEASAAGWSRATGGSVVELHAYACPTWRPTGAPRMPWRPGSRTNCTACSPRRLGSPCATARSRP